MNRGNKTSTQILTAIFSVFLLAASAAGATITVTNTNSSGAGSLSAAISSAASGDTIDFNVAGCPCVITGGYSFTGKDLFISGPGANQLTLSGGDTTRVFNIRNSSVTLSGLTIADGRASNNGGGVFFTGTNALGHSLTITNSVVTNNASTGGNPNGFGGGIYIEGGILNVINSTVSDNTATQGGGIATPINSSVIVTTSQSTISGNSANAAGGVFIGTTASLTSYNSNFSTNSAVNAAGILNSGSATIRGGTVSGNNTTGGAGDGGGIFNSGTLTLANVAVQNNTAANGGFGGGIYSTGESKITNSLISGNQASRGGGIYSTAAMSMKSSSVSGNTAAGTAFGAAGGGGIWNSSTADISDSTISGNTASQIGGGIRTTANMTLTNSTISGNQVLGASSFGGGINNENAATTVITNCTITLNSSANRGGGIANFSQSGNSNFIINIGNTIIAQNTAPGSTSISPDAIGDFISDGFNLIGNLRGSNSNGFTNGVKGDIVGTATLIDARLAPLANNGGATQTHALLADSPAIDHGNSAPGIVTDQRGNVRFFDVPAVAAQPGGNNSDIGAFEFASPTAATVLVAGRVLTSKSGGLAGAIVKMTKSDGIQQSFRTGSFGYFRFDGVTVGETYVVQVIAKGYAFEPQILTVSEEITELNFIAQTEK